MGSSPLSVQIEKGMLGFLLALALLLVSVSLHGMVPISDPMSHVGYLDRLSLLVGLHERASVVVVDSHRWSTDVYIYTFQRRLKDGAFRVESELRESMPFGILDEGRINRTEVRHKCSRIVGWCDSQLAYSSRKGTPLLFGLTDRLKSLAPDSRQLVLLALDECLAASDYEYDPEASVGVVSPHRQVVLQWFALSLLQGELPGKERKDTPVIVETTEDDLEITFAPSFDVLRIFNSTLKARHKVEVFGVVWDLVTVRIPDLGVYRARQLVLTNGDPKKEFAASPCVNPVVDRWWEWRGHGYHVKGLNHVVEEVKERNGPFAGKRVSRPVANYDGCHALVLKLVKSRLTDKYNVVVREMKKRAFYIRGKLFLKCAERGLTDPFKGGSVKLKAFMDSLRHACKVPNTDQPYACVDMMVAAVVLDKVLGLHQGSVLLTPQRVGAVTGNWPITAALQIYQSGL